MDSLTAGPPAPYEQRLGTRLFPQMRHYLGGKEIHVAPREIVREDAELEECHEDAEAGALAHPLDARENRPGAANQSGAALDETLGGELATATTRSDC